MLHQKQKGLSKRINFLIIAIPLTLLTGLSIRGCYNEYNKPVNYSEIRESYNASEDVSFQKKVMEESFFGMRPKPETYNQLRSIKNKQ